MIALPARYAAQADPLGAAVRATGVPRMAAEPGVSADRTGRFELRLPAAAPGGEAWILVPSRRVEDDLTLARPGQIWTVGPARPVPEARQGLRLELPLVPVEVEVQGLLPEQLSRGRAVVRELDGSATWESWDWVPRLFAPTDRGPRYARPGARILCAWIDPAGRYAEDVFDVPEGAASFSATLPAPMLEEPCRIGVRLANEWGRATVGLHRISVHSAATGLALWAGESEAPNFVFDLWPGTYLLRAGPIHPQASFCLTGGPRPTPLSRAQVQLRFEVRPGAPESLEVTLPRGGSLRVELSAPSAALHPALVAWRRGESDGADLFRLLVHGELPLGTLRLVDPAGGPTAPLALISPAGVSSNDPSLRLEGFVPGLSPLILDGRLPPGRHRLAIEAPGFEPSVVPVEILEGRAAELRVELVPVSGSAR